MRALVALLAFTLLAGACAPEGARDGDAVLSDRERDSVLAGSPLPGAGTVGRARTLSDSSAARAARLDSSLW